MNKLTSELLESIKLRQPIDTNLIPGYISTPVLPDEVFTIVKKANGEEFKRYLEADKWIAWLNSVADKTVDPEAEMTEKVIAGSKFHAQCELSSKEIVKTEENGMAGTIWLDRGNLYSISLAGDKIQEALDALQRVQECAIMPIPEDVVNLEDKYDTEKAATYLDIVKGGR